MASDELKEFEEEVRNKPIEYLLEMRKSVFSFGYEDLKEWLEK